MDKEPRKENQRSPEPRGCDKKAKDVKRGAAQNEQGVSLTLTRSSSNTAQGRKRGSSKTGGQGASFGEAKYGHDILLAQDKVTSPPGSRRPTSKSMGQDKKGVSSSTSRGASNSEESERLTSLSPTTTLQGLSHSTNQLSTQEEDVRKGDLSEGVVKGSLSPDVVTTLGSSVDPPMEERRETGSQLQMVDQTELKKFTNEKLTTRKGPTSKYKKYKVEKPMPYSVRKNRGALERQTPSFPTASHIPKDYSNIHRATRTRVTKKGSRLEGVVKTPISPNHVPPLNSFVDPPKKESEGTVPHDDLDSSEKRTRISPNRVPTLDSVIDPPKKEHGRTVHVPHDDLDTSKRKSIATRIVNIVTGFWSSESQSSVGTDKEKVAIVKAGGTDSHQQVSQDSHQDKSTKCQEDVTEDQIQVLTERLKIEDTKDEKVKQKLKLLEVQEDSSSEELCHQFEKLKYQYKQLEEHKDILVAENSQLRNELTMAEANLKKVQSTLDSSEAQAMVYKSDFEEERKDREATHSKLDLLRRRVNEQKEESKTVSNQLDLHMIALEDVEVVKKELEKAEMDAREDSKRWRAKAVQDHETLLAKTSQVEAYKKQVDQLKADLERQSQQLKEKEDDLEEKTSGFKVTLSRAQRVRRTLDLKLKQTQAQLPPKQESVHQYSGRALNKHAVSVRRPMKFDQPVGGGSYGAVYAVQHDGKHCIAKRLHDILVDRNRTNPISNEEKDGIHGKFVRECVLLSQMQHPNVVRFIGVINGRNKYDLTLLMERLSTDLQVYLKNSNIPFSLKVSILHDVSCGLLYLHDRSIIHRDLTAANVLLTVDSKAKIADLGVSRIYTRNLSQLSKLPGTLAFMPPEALKDRPVYDESLDVFSFGVLALYVAIQEFPEFSWENVPDTIIAKGEGEIHKRRSWIDKMNIQQPELISLVLWCLQDDPMKRPSTFCLDTLLKEMRKDY